MDEGGKSLCEKKCQGYNKKAQIKVISQVLQKNKINK